MKTTVGDVMTAEVHSVREGTGFKEIAETLLARNVSALPVVDGADRVVGVLSEEDLLHKAEFRGEDGATDYRRPMRAQLRALLTGGGITSGRAHERAMATTASELMTRPAVTVTPSATVTEAARLMERRGVKRVPVVDEDDVLVGLVSRRDLLRVFLRSDSDIESAVRDEVALVRRARRDTDVTVAVQDGVVTLTGSVPHRSTAYFLVRQVARIEGVVSVVDDLAWTQDDVLPPFG